MNYYDIGVGIFIWGILIGLTLLTIKKDTYKYIIIAFLVGMCVAGYPTQLELDEAQDNLRGRDRVIERLAVQYCETALNSTYQSHIVWEDKYTITCMPK